MKSRINEAALDTNILIDHFNNVTSITERMEKFDFLWIPVPVIAEMEFGFPRLKKPDVKREEFHAFFSWENIGIIDCDRTVAEHCGRIGRYLKKKGATIPVNDIWIAACCVSADKMLVTRDADFIRVPDLNVEICE